MTDVAQTAPPVIEPESPELHERNTWMGARLLVSSTVFLFLPFVFGYLYLASLNTAGHVAAGPPEGAAGLGDRGHAGGRRQRRARGVGPLRPRARQGRLFALARSRHSSSASPRWCCRRSSTHNCGFGPTDGGFASVFVGWTGLFALVVLGAMVWLEIIVASAFRNGSRAPGSSRADLDALGFYLTFVAGLGVFSFGFLYLI